MGLTSRMYTNKKNKSSRGDYTKGSLEIRKRKAGGGLHPEAFTKVLAPRPSDPLV